MTKLTHGRLFPKRCSNTGANATRSECMNLTWSVTEFQKPISSKLKRRSLKRSPGQRKRRSRAAIERCRNRRRLFREFTPGRTRGEKKHRQDQGDLFKDRKSTRLNSSH